MKYNTVIVTGGAGFIGSHLVDRLVDQAKRVVVIDKVKPNKQNKNAKAVYQKMDVRDDDVIDIFKKEKPDALFHLAAHMYDRESMEEPVKNAQNNIIGSLHVFEGMRRFGNGKMIFASSCAVYGNQTQQPIAEIQVPAPETPYGISKHVGEQYLRFYHQFHGVPFAALRFGNVYGPRQDSSAESGAISIFTSRLLRGETVSINNDGLTTRDYVFVDDVVDALLVAAERSFIGVVNIGTGVAMSTKELFNTICEVVGVQSVPDRREEVVDLLKHMALDPSLAKTELDWSPSVSLQVGLERTVRWYREHA